MEICGIPLDEDKHITLEEYIKELKHFYKLYSISATDDDAEELLMYQNLISWLEELQRHREYQKMIQEGK